MAQRGRPKRTMALRVIQLKLTLYPERDADLIRLFDECPRGSRASWVKAALRGNSQNVPVKKKSPSGRGLALQDFSKCEF